MKRGYIAITTAIILSFLILLVAGTFGTASLLSRSNNLDFYLKKTSYSAARSCLDYAILQLAQSSSYAGNQTIQVSSYQCTIEAVTTAGANKIIEATATVSGATTNLKLTLNASNLSTVSLEELSGF